MYAGVFVVKVKASDFDQEPRAVLKTIKVTIKSVGKKFEGVTDPIEPTVDEEDENIKSEAKETNQIIITPPSFNN